MLAKWWWARTSFLGGVCDAWQQVFTWFVARRGLAVVWCGVCEIVGKFWWWVLWIWRLGENEGADFIGVGHTSSWYMECFFFVWELFFDFLELKWLYEYKIRWNNIYVYILIEKNSSFSITLIKIIFSFFEYLKFCLKTIPKAM